MNFIQIIGTISKMPEIITKGTNERYSYIFVDVEANFRNGDGSVRVDTFKIQLWRGMSESVVASCVPGSLIAIKGRVEVEAGFYKIIAEHVEVMRR